MSAGPILEVQALRKSFAARRSGLFTSGIRRVWAVDGVDLTIRPGETLGLVGESGCGKTTLAMMLLGLETPTSGDVSFCGGKLESFDTAARRRYRADVQAVLQDPWSALSPRMKVGEIVGEPLIVHSQLNRRERDARVHRLLADVGLQPWQADLYPHEFSGGQRQRICIARALALEPKLIILDEPVSALDVSVQAQIINLLKSVQARTGVAYLLISHSLATVRYLCNRVAVMYLGQIVELGDGRAIFSNPRHPYTRALIEAARPIRKSDEPRDALHGEVPSPLNPPAGCRFHTRCSFAMDRCRSEGPSLDAISQSRSVRCHVFNSPVQGDLPDAVKEVMR